MAIDITTRLTPAKGVIGLKVKDSNGEWVPEKTREFEQVFTDFGFQSIYAISTNANANGLITGSGANYGLFRYCRAGFSNTERSNESTGLGSIASPVADANAFNLGSVATLEQIDDKWYVKTIRTYAFDMGAFNNATLSEIGLFSGNNNTSLLAGQLIKDNSNLPTTVTVLVTEQLFATYTFYIELPRIGGNELLNPRVFTSVVANIDGNDYDCDFEFVKDACYQTGGSGSPNYAVYFYTNAANQNNVLYINGTPVTSTQFASSITASPFANRIEYTETMTISGTYSQNLVIENIGRAMASGRCNKRIKFTPPLARYVGQSVAITFKHTLQWRSL